MPHGCASNLDPDRVDITDRFYKAGTDTLINAIDELPNDCPVALLIGHAPQRIARDVRADRPDELHQTQGPPLIAIRRHIKRNDTPKVANS